MTTPANFKAIVVRQNEQQQLSSAIETLKLDDLPPGEVLVRVAYSSLNFKDAAALANRAILRQFPIVPGIDFAGVVEQSTDARYQAGDEVVLTGWQVGEVHWGGLSQYARVKADWLVKKPAKFSLHDCMAIGTAGLTAMLCVLALEEQGLRPGEREVLVTGAAGGVGSVAVKLLARKGYKVAALSGRAETESGYLHELGATSIVPRDEFSTPKRPGRMTMDKETYAGAVDVVGGAVLSAVLPRIAYGGSVAVCGLAGGADFDTTVFPFILRGIRMIGIDSVRAPTELRLRAWNALTELIAAEDMNKMANDIALDQVFDTCSQILAGKIRGRCVVQLW